MVIDDDDGIAVYFQSVGYALIVLRQVLNGLARQNGVSAVECYRLGGAELFYSFVRINRVERGVDTGFAHFAIRSLLQTENVSSLLAQVSEYFVDRKSTRLNSSHANISYAVFCLKKKKTEQ